MSLQGSDPLGYRDPLAGPSTHDLTRGSRPGPLQGLASLSEGLRLLRSHRELWPIASAPVAASLVAFGIAVTLFVWSLDPLTAWVQGWIAVDSPTVWYGWLWVGPLRALAWMVRWLLVLLFGVVLYLSLTLVGGVLASPFLDVLSRRVERIRTGTVHDVTPPGVLGVLRAGVRVAIEEGKRAGFFLAVQGMCLALGLLPGLQAVALVLGVGFAALFLPLDYAGYILDRRGARFADRRRWVWQNKGTVAAFGGAALGTFMVPGLNFLALPWLVTAATLLALEIGLPGSPPSPDPSDRATRGRQEPPRRPGIGRTDRVPSDDRSR